MKIGLAAGVIGTILLLAVTLAFAHRLDEYLQGTLISVEKNRVDVQITLTPGVAVFPGVLADIDTDADGVISAVERRAYALRVLRDLSLRIDGHPLTPQLLAVEFPAIEEMQGGRGAIRIEFDAALPSGGINRRLIFENHHFSRIAAYQVNCLAPRDRDIRILAQKRNYSQSFYELEYTQPGIRADLLSLVWWPVVGKLPGALALVLVACLAWFWRQRGAAYRGGFTISSTARRKDRGSSAGYR